MPIKKSKLNAIRGYQQTDETSSAKKTAKIRQEKLDAIKGYQNSGGSAYTGSGAAKAASTVKSTGVKAASGGMGSNSRLRIGNTGSSGFKTGGVQTSVLNSAKKSTPIGKSNIQLDTSVLNSAKKTGTGSAARQDFSDSFLTGDERINLIKKASGITTNQSVKKMGDGLIRAAAEKEEEKARNTMPSNSFSGSFLTGEQRIENAKKLNTDLKSAPTETALKQAQNVYEQWNQRYKDADRNWLNATDNAIYNDTEEAKAEAKKAKATKDTVQSEWSSTMQSILDSLGDGAKAQFSRWANAGDDAKKNEYWIRLKNTYGTDLAKQVGEYVQQQVNAGKMEEVVTSAEDYAEEHPILGSFRSVPQNIVGGVTGTVDALLQGAERSFTGSNAPIDWNTKAQESGQKARTTRETVASGLNESYGSSVPGFLYQTGMSMLDSVATMPLSVAVPSPIMIGGKQLSTGTILLGMSAANSSMQEAKAKGATDSEAVSLGVIVGAVEALTEQMSLDSLLGLDDVDSASSLFRTMGRQVVPEAGEEAVSEAADMVAEVLVLGDKSEFKQQMAAYEADGDSKGMAFAKAIGNAAMDVGLSALGGGLSGGTFALLKGVGGYGINRVLGGTGNAAENAAETVGNAAKMQQSGNVSENPTGSLMEQAAGLPSQSPAVTAFPKGEPRLSAGDGREVRGNETEVHTGETDATRMNSENMQDTLSEQARGLAQRLAALGKDGETAAELARDIEGYFWGDVYDEATVQRLANDPEATTVMEWLMEQGEYPGKNSDGAAERAAETAGNAAKMQRNDTDAVQNGQDVRQEVDSSIQKTLEQLEREKRAAKAENETQRTGILAGASDETIAQAERVGKLVGREVVFFSEEADANGGIKDGYYSREDGKIHVNANSQNPEVQIIAHELTHSIEGSTDYARLQGIILRKIRADGGDLTSLRSGKQTMYERHGVTDVDVDSEIVAEYVEKNLLTDEKSIAEFVRENRTLGQRIMDFIDNLLAKLGNKNARERAFLSQTKKYYQSALQQSQEMESRAQEQTRSLAELREKMASGELSEEEAWQAFNEIYDAELDLQNGLRGEQYSFGGEKSRTADLDALKTAREMAKEDVDSETIRKQTGWFQGMDGKWRYEIDDSGMEFDQSGNKQGAVNRQWAQEDFEAAKADLMESLTAEQKDEIRAYNRARLDGDLEEESELYPRLAGKYGKAFTDYVDAWDTALEYQSAKGTGVRLADYLTHDELFEAYPELRDVRVELREMDPDELGSYSRERNTITLNSTVLDGTEDTLIHEVQHAIQNTEGFAKGSSSKYWKDKINRAHRDTMEAKYALDHSPAIEELEGQFQRGELDEEDYSYEYSRLVEEDTDAREKYEAWQAAQRFENQVSTSGTSSESLYRNTAGEIEARDASRRRTWSAEQRRENAPDLGDENTVFADGGESYNMSQSEQDSVKEQLREHQDALNNMKAVATIRDNGWRGMSTGAFRQKIIKDLKKTGYRIDNPNIGVIDFNEKLLNRSLNYIQTDAEAAAYQALPQVLKRGIEISGHGNHKGRDYETLTIAAPVELNGKRGNMAVIVMKTKGNRYKVHRILTPEGKAFALPEMTNAELTTAGTVTSGSQSLGGSTPAISSASGNSVLQNQGNDNNQYSFSEDQELSELDRGQLGALEELAGARTGIPSQSAAVTAAPEGAPGLGAVDIRETLPVKAREYLNRTERTLLDRVQTALGVDKFSDKAGLQEVIREISNAYLENGSLSQEQTDQLFEKAYREGIVTETEFYNRYKWVRDKLRTTRITLDKGYQSSIIGGWNSFRQSAMGRLRIANDGMSVDSLYQELSQEAPELFPESIVNPADQIEHMFNVAKSIEISERNIGDSMGSDAADFKAWAKNDFEAAVADTASELRNVKRYSEARNQQESAQVPTTPEEAMEAYGKLKQARWNSEKAKAKNLLTDSDRLQVGRLLKGEIALSDLDSSRDNVQGITAVYEATREYDSLCKTLNRYKQAQRAKLMERAGKHLQNALLWKDKKAGVLYSRETMERNITDIAPDQETADAVIGDYIRPVHKAEAESTRFKDQYRERVRALDLSQKTAKGNRVSEAYAVQFLGEAEDNIRMIENSRGRIKQRDGYTAEEWRGMIQTMKAENRNMDWGKIQNATKEFRSIYNELFTQMNEVRVRNGYEPINYRQGYFPHFQQGEDTVLTRLGQALGIDTQSQTLPTSINGITSTFKPGITWFKFGQQRTGYQTAYDAVQGFDQYIVGASSVIHQTDNIQNLRALAAQIRYMTGDEGLKKQIDAVYADQTLTEEEKRIKLQDIYQNGQYTLSNFVNELDEYTNLLANKKSKLDRGMEAMIGRRAYTIMKNFESRVGANMVAGNLGSAMTNFIPLTQAGAQIDTKTLLSGMWDTLKSYKTDDGFVKNSTFLTNRRGSEPITMTFMQKLSKVAGTPMEYIDNFTADSIVRARFRQNMARGMSESLAMEEADDFAGHVMADRSKGSQPTLFASNNPAIKAFTQFQLEVNNQFSEIFKDIPRAYRDKGIAALTAALLKYFFGAWVYNEVYEKIVGRRAALDPIGILNDTVGDLTGYEMPNMVTLAGNAISGEETSFETEKVGIGEAGSNLAQNLLEELPFSSGLGLVGIELDGGRIPVSSAIPDLSAFWNAATTEGWSGKKRWSEAQDELNKLAYVLPPFGGSQISKGVKAVKQLTEGGKYTVDAEGNDNLQYPIDNSAGNWARAAVFGTSSLPEAQEYWDKGQTALNGNQTAILKKLEAAGVDAKTTYNLYQTLQEVKKEKSTALSEANARLDTANAKRKTAVTDKEIEEAEKAVQEAEAEADRVRADAKNRQRDEVNALDLTDEQKFDIYKNMILDSGTSTYEDTVEALQGMMDSGLSWDQITEAENHWESLSGTQKDKSRDMADWMSEQGWTSGQQETVYAHYKQGSAATGSDKYEYLQERADAGIPEETILQALTEDQQEKYESNCKAAKVSAGDYLDVLSFYKSATTDRDRDGKTVSGSKKAKVVEYISGLNLSRKQKRALYLCFYKGDDFK